jgi:enoyl-CoA hydratase
VVAGLKEIRTEGVLTVVFDRPAARNALTVAMRQRLEELCAEVDGDDDIDVVVLTGTDPAFCAGADMKEIASQGRALPPTDPGRAIRGVRKPVIGAVNGPCVTGGLEIALSCDFLVASELARFADTHAHLGVLPRWGMSALLPRAVGVRWAKELSATRAVIDSAEALRIGLVNHVVPHDQLGGARPRDHRRHPAGTCPRRGGHIRALRRRTELLAGRSPGARGGAGSGLGGRPHPFLPRDGSP